MFISQHTLLRTTALNKGAIRTIDETKKEWHLHPPHVMDGGTTAQTMAFQKRRSIRCERQQTRDKGVRRDAKDKSQSAWVEVGTGGGRKSEETNVQLRFSHGITAWLARP